VAPSLRGVSSAPALLTIPPPPRHLSKSYPLPLAARVPNARGFSHCGAHL